MDHPANQEEDPEVDYGEDDDNFAEQQEEVVPDEDAHAIEDEKGTLDHQVQLDNHAPDGDDADELKPIHEHEDALEARSADEEHHLSQSAEQQDINQQADDHVESLYDQDQEQGQNDNGNEELDPSQEGQEQLLNDQDEMVNEQDDPPHEQDDEQVQNESAMQDVEVQNNQGDSTVEDAVEGETIAEKVASSQRGRSSDSGSRPNGAGGAIANRPSLRGAVEAGQGQGPTTRMRQPDWPTRYFIIKSFNHDDVAISIERGIWATQARNESKLNEAFSKANVILIFSVNESRHFQGYAIMQSIISKEQSSVWTQANGAPKSWGGVFKVKWLAIYDLPFEDTLHLRNTWNDNKPVKISRDGQELPVETGLALCGLIDQGSSKDTHKRKPQGGGPPEDRFAKRARSAATEPRNRNDNHVSNQRGPGAFRGASGPRPGAAGNNPHFFGGGRHHHPPPAPVSVPLPLPLPLPIPQLHYAPPAQSQPPGLMSRGMRFGPSGSNAMDRDRYANEPPMSTLQRLPPHASNSHPPVRNFPPPLQRMHSPVNSQYEHGHGHSAPVGVHGPPSAPHYIYAPNRTSHDRSPFRGSHSYRETVKSPVQSHDHERSYSHAHSRHRSRSRSRSKSPRSRKEKRRPSPRHSSRVSPPRRDRSLSPRRSSKKGRSGSNKQPSSKLDITNMTYEEYLASQRRDRTSSAGPPALYKRSPPPHPANSSFPSWHGHGHGNLQPNTYSNGPEGYYPGPAYFSRPHPY